MKNSTGANLEGVTVCISPAPSARIQAAAESQSLSGFMNYPNPFTSDTYLTYFLGTQTAQSVSISIYDLRRDLQQEFLDASTAQGPNKIFLTVRTFRIQFWSMVFTPVKFRPSFPGIPPRSRSLCPKGSISPAREDCNPIRSAPRPAENMSSRMCP